MITAHEAFLLGYTLPIIGIYFNGVELIASASNGAAAPLAQRVKERFDAFQARQPGVIENVRFVESLLHKAGLPVAPPPRLPEEFYRWSQQIFEETHAALSGEESVVASASHLLGFLLGDASGTLNLGGFVHLLLDAAPAHAGLLAQARSLAQAQVKARRKLEQALALPALPETTRAAAQAAVQAFFEAPPIDADGDHAAKVRGLDASLRQLGQAITAVEQTLQ